MDMLSVLSVVTSLLHPGSLSVELMPDHLQLQQHCVTQCECRQRLDHISRHSTLAHSTVHLYCVEKITIGNQTEKIQVSGSS